MSQIISSLTDSPVRVINAAGSSATVLVCEHASHDIPSPFNGLGLAQADRESHAAWDPGAMAVAEGISTRLDAPLVSSTVSRLVYDCNRPPEASDAMPAKSELIDVPGNRNLSVADRQARVDAYYTPFKKTLATTIAAKSAPVIVTIHSFTPVYKGQERAVEIGILHDTDSRLADAMLETASAHCSNLVERNEPYGPEDGVTHTLRENAIPHSHLNVMIEIRNDLIATETQQDEMAALMARWLTTSIAIAEDKS